MCNLGNRCFLNSVLDTLRFTPGFLHSLHHMAHDLGLLAAAASAGCSGHGNNGSGSSSSGGGKKRGAFGVAGNVAMCAAETGRRPG